MAPYTAVKHAVAGINDLLAAELHGSHVGVTILCPKYHQHGHHQKHVTSGETSAHKVQTIAFYEKNGAPPEKVARDLLNDVRRNKFAQPEPAPAGRHGLAAVPVVPRLAMTVMRGQIRKVMGASK